MNERRAYCPKCARETAFVESASGSMCTECGTRFGPAERDPWRPSSPTPVLKGVLSVLAVVALIMVAIVVVGGAVLFAGCAGLLKGF